MDFNENLLLGALFFFGVGLKQARKENKNVSPVSDKRAKFSNF